jgi:hypothetical protein
MLGYSKLKNSKRILSIKNNPKPIMMKITTLTA